MSVNRTHPIGGVDVLASDPLVCPSPGGKTGRILLPGGPFKQDSGRPKEVLVLFGVLSALYRCCPQVVGPWCTYKLTLQAVVTQVSRDLLQGHIRVTRLLKKRDGATCSKVQPFGENYHCCWLLL